MHRIWAIIERDLRRFRRSPILVVVSILMPIVQLVVLGYAFGGRIRNLEIGIVDQDHGVPAVRLHEMCQAVAANAKTFYTRSYADEGEAMHDLREGRIDAIIQIPPEFSRKVLAGANPRFALIEDNTDQFSANTLEGIFNGILASYNREPTTAPGAPAVNANISLAVVEVYPYVPYIQFLLPGTIVLSIFVSAMIGGGIIYIDDKARGLHEGYLVTPIRKVELVMGFNLAGAAKAIIAGLVLTTVGSLIAGIPDPFNLWRLSSWSASTTPSFPALSSGCSTPCSTSPVAPSIRRGHSRRGCEPFRKSTPSPTACMLSKNSSSKTPPWKQSPST
jgi:ABC-2 type transport system permease protein